MQRRENCAQNVFGTEVQLLLICGIKLLRQRELQLHVLEIELVDDMLRPNVREWMEGSEVHDFASDLHERIEQGTLLAPLRM
eukprot:Skav213553  [mRNA]  locus=scaffold263:65818:66973:- [translate_table: standard]